MMEIPNQDILGLTPVELAGLTEQLGGKPFHGRQVFRWVNQRGVFDFERMTDLPLELRKTLQAQVPIRLPKIVHSSTASSDGATKLLLQYPDRQGAEAGIIRNGEKITLCLS